MTTRQNGQADAAGEEPEAPEAPIVVLSGNATAEEAAAAVTAVTAALEELAAAGPEEEEPRISAWQRSQRAVRAPIVPGQGRWRGFGA